MGGFRYRMGLHTDLATAIGDVCWNSVARDRIVGQPDSPRCYRGECDQGRESRMTEFYATVIFLFVLFALLGGSVWIGLA